jgi:hypothetical protein
LGARSGSCRRERLTVPATGAVRIPDGGLAPTRSAVATTVANSPWRFAAVARASSSALRPPESKACVASSTKRTSKPMSEPARPVVSQQWLGVTPHTAMPSHPARAARRPGRATPGTRSAMTSRPEIGLAGDVAFPRLSGLSGEPCSRESWRTNTTGRAASRHAAISSAMLLRRPGSRSRAPCPASSTAGSASEVAPTAPQSQGTWEPVGSRRGDCPVRVAMTRPRSRSTTCSRRPGLVRTYASDPAPARISVGSLSSTWKARSPSGS